MERLWLRISILFCFMSLALRLALVQSADKPATNGAVGDYAGSAACAVCHKDIYQSYLASPMARSSGQVGEDDFRESLAAGQFRHERSGGGDVNNPRFGQVTALNGFREMQITVRFEF
jgi:cytochrome c553